MIDVQSLRLIAALASFALLVNIYDWLRLFQITGFFVTLVEKTLTDILPFMFLFALAMLAFGVPYALIDLNREDEGEGNLIKSQFFTWVLDVVYNQFMLAIG